MYNTYLDHVTRTASNLTALRTISKYIKHSVAPAIDELIIDKPV